MFLDVSHKIGILWLHHFVIFKNDSTLDLGVPFDFDMMNSRVKNPGLEDDSRGRKAESVARHGKPDTRPGKHTKNDGKSPFFMGKLNYFDWAIFKFANC